MDSNKNVTAYFSFMKELSSSIKSGKKLVMSDLVKKHKISKTLPTVLKNMGVIKKNNNGDYEWKTTPVTKKLAEQALDNLSKYNVSKSTSPGSKPKQETKSSFDKRKSKNFRTATKKKKQTKSKEIINSTNGIIDVNSPEVNEDITSKTQREITEITNAINHDTLTTKISDLEREKLDKEIELELEKVMSHNAYKKLKIDHDTLKVNLGVTECIVIELEKKCKESNNRNLLLSSKLDSIEKSQLATIEDLKKYQKTMSDLKNSWWFKLFGKKYSL